MPKRDTSIDLIRALLVVYVVAYLHLGGYLGDGSLHVHWSTVAYTNLVLGAFTFISGYLLGAWKGSLTRSTLLRFYTKRFFRIYPLFVVALLAFVALWLTDGLSALKAALGVSMFFPPAPMTLWYIAMILPFYVLAPLFVVPRISRAIVAGISLWFVMLFYGLFLQTIDARVLTHFAAFVFGIIYRRLDLRSNLGTRVGPVLAAFAVAHLVAILSLGNPLLEDVAAIPSVILGSILMVQVADRYFMALGATPWVVSLSYVSFSAYLFHRVVFEVLKRVYWPPNMGLQVVLLVFVGLPCIWGASLMIQRSYDRAIDVLARRMACMRT